MNSMDDWYLMGIEKYKRGNMDIYNELLDETYGKKLPWKEVKKLPKEEQRNLMYSLKTAIKIHKSDIDISKLARAIQNSRSGIGGSAITFFTCLFCKKNDSWGNTAIPNICHTCAKEMARKIVLNGGNIFKD